MYPFDQGDDTKNLDIKQKLQTFLEQISLMTNLDGLNEENNQAKVTLMSLHQSKGLEFETVFLVGIEDGLLPHINSLNEDRGIEEEVRLAYVGVTRAKKYLHLSAAESRVQFGQIKANPVSRIFRPLLDKYAQRSL
jgi:DNA helicase-2/ATP-dependent DNA helicase PcrA